MTTIEFLRSGKMSDVSVAIMGDVVLDRYLAGSTTRVSREAPIPVLVCEQETDNLGGAGNVAANLRGLDCRTMICGRICADGAGDRIEHYMRELAIEAQLFISQVPTLTKTRLICGGQQVARFDREDALPLSEQETAAAISWLRELLANGKTSALILSDYGLGFCSASLCRQAIAEAAAHDVPVFVDPRGMDWSKYSGAACVTPNLGELAAVYGAEVSNDDEAVLAAGRSVMKKYGLRSLLVTRSARGMTLLEQEKSLMIAARPVEVFDVSGAGDTVIAALAACTAAGFSLADAARFANDAAQIVVTKAGTCPIHATELLTESEKPSQDAAARCVSREEAVRICRQWQRQGERVVFTNGCFDVLHAGHADSLSRARGLGSRLIVGLNSDRSVHALKGTGRPVNAEAERARLLAMLRPVDLVVIFDEDTPAELLAELRPDVLAKGGDYRADQLPGRQYVKEVVILPLVAGLSTTEILRRLTDGKMRP